VGSLPDWLSVQKNVLRGGKERFFQDEEKKGRDADSGYAAREDVDWEHTGSLGEQGDSWAVRRTVELTTRPGS